MRGDNGLLSPSLVALRRTSRLARNDVASTEYDSAISRRDAPELLLTGPPQEERAQGMPGACCTRGLVCKSVQRNAHEHTGTVGAFRHSLRNGFTAYTVLSPATNSSCHRHWRIEGLSKPGWVDAPPSAWHQQRVPGPHGFAVRSLPTSLRPPSSETGLRRVKPGIGAGRLRAVFAHGPRPALRTRPRAQRCRVHRVPPQRSWRWPTPLYRDGMGEL